MFFEEFALLGISAYAKAPADCVFSRACASAQNSEKSTKKALQTLSNLKGKKPGNDLLSREVPVSSALECLTTVFDKGTGMTTPPESPRVKQNVFCFALGNHLDCQYFSIRRWKKDGLAWCNYCTRYKSRSLIVIITERKR